MSELSVHLYLLKQPTKRNCFHSDIFTFGDILQGQRNGSVRVSSFNQNPERQLEQIDICKVFTDKDSRKYTQRSPMTNSHGYGCSIPDHVRRRPILR